MAPATRLKRQLQVRINSSAYCSLTELFKVQSGIKDSRITINKKKHPGFNSTKNQIQYGLISVKSGQLEAALLHMDNIQRFN